MAVYTHLSDEDMDEIAARYGLGAVTSWHGITEGIENSNYLLTTENQKVILTIYEKRLNTDDLPFFLGIKEHLAERGISCPLPLHTLEGHQTFAIYGKTAAVVSFLNGKSTSIIRNSHLTELGCAMAKMHLAAESFTLERRNDLSLSGWKKLIERINNEPEKIDINLKKYISDEYSFLENNWPDNLPSGVIHADLFPDNVFFDDNGALSGIIDFYFACNDIFLYDVAIAMNAWCFEPRHDFNITKAGLLLKSYHAVRDISAAEREALPILCRGAALRFFLTRAYDWLHPQPGAVVTPKDPKEYLKKLRFHQQVSHYTEYGIER
jgi:homoserine kinase type II